MAACGIKYISRNGKSVRHSRRDMRIFMLYLFFKIAWFLCSVSGYLCHGLRSLLFHEIFQVLRRFPFQPSCQSRIFYNVDKAVFIKIGYQSFSSSSILRLLDCLKPIVGLRESLPSKAFLKVPEGRKFTLLNLTDWACMSVFFQPGGNLSLSL